MPKGKLGKKFPWKEKYDHVFNCYVSLWNSALNFIVDNFGKKELDRYFMESMEKGVLGQSTFADLSKGTDTDTFIRSYVPHHIMIGGEVEIVKAEPNEIVVDLKRCGSKSMLVKKFGKKASHYCRHCEIIPLWEQLGWKSKVDKSRAAVVEGQNIGCRRIFRRMEK